MYSYEDRMRAVKLYIQYHRSAAATVRELGYPSKKNLRRWHEAYMRTGDLPERSAPKPKYSPEQKQKAVQHYLGHGCCLARTRKALGYPSVGVLREWVMEQNPGRRQVSAGSSKGPPLSPEAKREAVIELCSRQDPATKVAKNLGVSRQVLYKWTDQLLGDEANPRMKRRDDEVLPLEQEVKELQRRVHRLQLEHDLLAKANDLIKKDLGVDLRLLTNREKTLLVDALRQTYRLSEILSQLCLPRSSYFYHRARIQLPDKYATVRVSATQLFETNHRCYGYRRIRVALNRLGIVISEKVVRRLMAEEQLIVQRRKCRRYRSYRGEITPAPENLVNRDFSAPAPNRKWLTDITEFQIPAGKVYLSPVIDCFDGLAVSWTISTSPDATLVNTMLDDAIATLEDGETPIIHSDRGAHYRWPGWLARIQDVGLIRSMSRKGCSPDNAACEGFFGRLKTEFFYPRDWHGITLEQFFEELDEYIRWHNRNRVKLSLGGQSPLEYRERLGLAA
ncbi:IS3 family transposase [Alkalilimnicola ehrlichii MLHE-1]|uniref:Integrase, catalytic region n=1 Tax=Alkalilimnicola ehrlichii (strain ATCC BAA-1101 / DSM 17681 / MLHE-1) TaxID=187272 RepID=Q0A8F6_ALKEH|nr:IS3 family transposase [Alkalilimnicola ehrlichii]ABI56878.1 Integrase, catalytic region [Alkalilimnicola ehrlichii MLHE-1]ABI56881.1 Integrase, catalytic region [Alkalilimnicola ehrlichii MLHE-1]